MLLYSFHHHNTLFYAFLSENDAGLDIDHWSGHSGCVILAPHIKTLTKKSVGLPHVSEATERQRELCDRFSAGIHLFRNSNWEKASSEFKSILKQFPQDGPSRFYRAQCRLRLKAESLPDRPTVITLTEK